MERATTSLPTPVSPRMSTFALLRAAISMLRRRATVVSSWPSSTAVPSTGFPIERILFGLRGCCAAQGRAPWCSSTREHHLRSDLSRTVDAKTAILPVVVSRFKGKRAAFRATQRYKNETTERCPAYLCRLLRTPGRLTVARFLYDAGRTWFFPAFFAAYKARSAWARNASAEVGRWPNANPMLA